MQLGCQSAMGEERALDDDLWAIGYEWELEAARFEAALLSELEAHSAVNSPCARLVVGWAHLRVWYPDEGHRHRAGCRLDGASRSGFWFELHTSECPLPLLAITCIVYFFDLLCLTTFALYRDVTSLSKFLLEAYARRNYTTTHETSQKPPFFLRS